MERPPPTFSSLRGPPGDGLRTAALPEPVTAPWPLPLRVAFATTACAILWGGIAAAVLQVLAR